MIRIYRDAEAMSRAAAESFAGWAGEAVAARGNFIVALAGLELGVKQAVPPPKALILNFPANPTTHCVDLDFFEEVIAVATSVPEVRRLLRSFRRGPEP